MITFLASIVLPQLSVNVQSTSKVPPHSLYSPLNSPCTSPAIKHGPVPLLVYDNVPGWKTLASSQEIVISSTGSNSAAGAGNTVTTCCAVIVLLQRSVNVQSTSNVPPHSSYVPDNSPGTVPEISQAPVPPLEYINDPGANVFACSQEISILSTGSNSAAGAGSTVITFLAVIVLSHLSVNVQSTSNVPPHSL